MVPTFNSLSCIKLIRSDLFESLYKISDSDKGNSFCFTFKLSHHLILSKNVFLARWDGEDWVTSGKVFSYMEQIKFKILYFLGFTNEKLDIYERTMSFRPQKFGPYALFYDLHFQFPYKEWFIKPIGFESIQVTLITSAMRIEIGIKKGSMCLISPNILKGYYNTATFFKKLQYMGLNLIPVIDDRFSAQIFEKDQHLEDLAYQSMSLIAPALKIASSK